jgi:hypothetical protein
MLDLSSSHNLSAVTVYIPVSQQVMSADLRWHAGFVDGEGCIRIARRNPGNGANDIFSLELTISQNRLETLEYFKAGLGIRSSIYVYPCTGNLRRPVYGLTYRCTRANQALALLVPYLVRKRREALLGIEFADHVSSVYRQGRRRHSEEEMALREDYYLRMRALK